MSNANVPARVPLDVDLIIKVRAVARLGLSEVERVLHGEIAGGHAAEVLAWSHAYKGCLGKDLVAALEDAIVGTFPESKAAHAIQQERRIRAFHSGSAEVRRSCYALAVAEGACVPTEGYRLTRAAALACAASDGMSDFGPMIAEYASELDIADRKYGFGGSEALLALLRLREGGSTAAEAQERQLQRMGQGVPGVGRRAWIRAIGLGLRDACAYDATTDLCRALAESARETPMLLADMQREGASSRCSVDQEVSEKGYGSADPEQLAREIAATGALAGSR